MTVASSAVTIRPVSAVAPKTASWSSGLMVDMLSTLALHVFACKNEGSRHGARDHGSRRDEGDIVAVDERVGLRVAERRGRPTNCRHLELIWSALSGQ